MKADTERFSRDHCAQLLDSLKMWARAEGCAVDKARVTYTPGVGLQITVGLIDSSGPVAARERDMWTHHATHYGLDPSWLDRTFSVSGTTYTIVGLRARARSKPVLVLRQDGRQFIFPVADIKRLMGKSSEVRP